MNFLKARKQYLLPQKESLKTNWILGLAILVKLQNGGVENVKDWVPP